MENRGLRVGLKGAADKSHLSGIGKGNSLCDISVPRCSDALNMSGRKGRKGVGREGLVRRQPAKVVSFHVLAVPLLRDHLVLVTGDLAAGGGRWSGKECALWVRGGCTFPLPAPQLQEFSLESNKGGTAHHVADTPLDFLFGM